MAELAGPLCLLAFVLLIITACGHGMWLLAEGFLKVLFGDTSRPAPKPQRCLKCGWLAVEHGHCTHCGDVPATSLALRSRNDLQATARQLSRLHRNGQVPYDQCYALLKLIEADLSRLGGALPLEVWPEVSRAGAQKTESPFVITDDAPPIEAKPGEAAVASEQPVVTGSPEAAIDAFVIDENTAAPLAPPVAAQIAAPPTAAAPANPFAFAQSNPEPVVTQPPAPLTPSRTLADMLQGFMEESNIRWGEILGGLLIVTCAIGLVISLRATLEYIPYFPALLFMLFTVAFHGAGLYTLRRWKLAAVSRAILIIALLLVPLAFSAGVVLPGKGDAQRPLNDPLLLTAVLVGLSVFGWVSYSGSRELAGEGALRLTTAILGCSFAQVVINRGAFSGMPRTSMSLLAFLPVAAFLIAALGQVWRAQAWRKMSGRRIEQTFLILGVSLFALLPPIALLIFKVEPRWLAFKHLSPLLSLVATTVLTLGIVVHRRALTRALAPLRTAGTSIALVAGALLIMLWVVAWPLPELMLNVSLLTGALLLAVAIRTRMAALHAAAVSALSVGAVVAFFWAAKLVSGSEPTSLEWLQASLQGRTSLLLTALAAPIGGCGAWFFTQRDRRIGIAYLATAVTLGALGLLVAGWSGFVPLPAPWTGDGDIAGPLFLCYAIALFAIAFCIVDENVLTAAMALLWIALIQLFWANETAIAWLTQLHLLPERPVLVATILEASVLAVMALVLSRKTWRMPANEFADWQRTEQFSQLVLLLTYGAAIAIITATPFIAWVLPGRFAVHALYALLAAGVWGLLCLARRWPAALSALQAMLAVAAAFAIAAFWVPADAVKDNWWFLRGSHLHAQVLALAGSALIWSIVRRAVPPKHAVQDLLNPPYPPCDHVLLGLATMLLTVLCVSAAAPGIAKELNLAEEPLSVANIAWLDPAHTARLVWGLTVVVAAFVVALVDRITGWKWIGLSLAVWSGVFLLALNWQAEVATASAARWWLALYGCLLMAVFVARQPLQRGLQSQTWLRWNPVDVQEREWLRYQSLILGVAPVLLLTIIAVVQNASGVQLPRPQKGSIFEWLGPTASYAGPLLIGVVIFLGQALGQRQPAFALGGSLLFQLVANLAFILHITDKPLGPAGSPTAEWLQWNTLAAAIYSLLWLALAVWLLPRKENAPPIRIRQEKFFLLQVGASCWLLLAVAIWAAATIIRYPSSLAAESRFLGSWSNLAGLGLVAAPVLTALGVTRTARTWPRGASGLVLLLIAATPLLAIRWELTQARGSWAAYHLLEIAWLAIAAAVALSYSWLRWTRTAREEHLERRGFAPHHLLAAALCGCVILLATRGNGSDPAEPYVSCAVTAGAAAVFILLGIARRSQAYAIASLAAAPLAAALPWYAPSAMAAALVLKNSQPLVALCSCLLAATLVGGWWQLLEIRSQRLLSQTFAPRWRGPLAGHLAIVIVVLLLAGASVLHLLFAGSDWYRSGLPPYDLGLIGLVVTWLLLGGVIGGSIWDRRAKFIFPALFVWAWIAGALALTPLHEQPLAMFCLHALATAGILALAGHLWSYGANLAAWGERLGIDDTIGGLTRIERWLPSLSLLLGLAISGLELLGLFNLPLREHRVAIAFSPALIAYSLACLAQKGRQGTFQLTALLLGGLSCIYLGWSDLIPGWTLTEWMTRAFRLLMVLGVTTLAYGLVLPRWVLGRLGFGAPSWLQASQRAGYTSSVLAIATLVSLLALEVSLFEPGVGAGVEPVQVAAVAVLLVFFIAGLISLALAPGARREQIDCTWYVYAAQAVAGLLFAHLYLCQPAWFDGVLKPYWPYIIMAIAFSGVGLGELFWRLRLPVLAEPFQRTGAFLPVLPILGLWVIASKNTYDYTLLLFLTGLMYLMLAIVRKSWAAAVAATIAGNGALWALLKQNEWRPDLNPQFWLIPPAVSVLVAAHINRHRLKPEMLSAIRYAALIVIYVSSTFEIFLHHADKSLWPPILLALLSLFGALAGVLLRIRAFLYLGAVFTLLAMVSMVWHAARAIEHVWPWWAFGIGMGIAILAGLALFEKNRPQVQALIARLRQWEK